MRACAGQQYRAVEMILSWYEVRDLLLGDNFVAQNVNAAIQLAARCQHTEAVWLMKMFPLGHIQSAAAAKEVFLAQGEDDPRALCFAALILRSKIDRVRLRRSAELGYALAQAKIAWSVRGQERLEWANASAAQGERAGLYMLGFWFNNLGRGKDLLRAKEYYLIAAEVGELSAMVSLGRILIKSDPKRYFWFGKAAARGYPRDFLDCFVKQLSNLNSVRVMFAIGRALNGHVNAEKREIFGETYDFDARIGPANRAIEFYGAECLAARRTVDAWTIVGRRKGIVKDVRLLIARLIWDSTMYFLSSSTKII